MCKFLNVTALKLLGDIIQSQKMMLVFNCVGIWILGLVLRVNKTEEIGLGFNA